MCCHHEGSKPNGILEFVPTIKDTQGEKVRYGAVRCGDVCMSSQGNEAQLKNNSKQLQKTINLATLPYI